MSVTHHHQSVYMNLLFFRLTWTKLSIKTVLLNRRRNRQQWKKGVQTDKANAVKCCLLFVEIIFMSTQNQWWCMLHLFLLHVKVEWHSKSIQTMHGSYATLSIGIRNSSAKYDWIRFFHGNERKNSTIKTSNVVQAIISLTEMNLRRECFFLSLCRFSRPLNS